MDTAMSTAAAAAAATLPPFQKYSIYAASDAKLTLRNVMTLREAVDQRQRSGKRAAAVAAACAVIENDDEQAQAQPQLSAVHIKRRRRMLLFPQRGNCSSSALLAEAEQAVVEDMAYAKPRQVRFAASPVSYIVDDSEGGDCDDSDGSVAEEETGEAASTSTWYSDADNVQFQLECRQTVHLLAQQDESLLNDDEHYTLLGLENFLTPAHEQERQERVRRHRRAVLRRLAETNLVVHPLSPQCQHRNRQQRRVKYPRRHGATQACLEDAIRHLPVFPCEFE